MKGVAVVVGRARGRRCARSWRYTEDVGSDPAYPDVSARDAAALHELKAGGPPRRMSIGPGDAGSLARPLYAAVFLLTLVLDQATKLWLYFVVDIAVRQPIQVAPFLDLILVWNPGHLLRDAAAIDRIRALGPDGLQGCGRDRPYDLGLAREGQAAVARARPDCGRRHRQRHRFARFTARFSISFICTGAASPGTSSMWRMRPSLPAWSCSCMTALRPGGRPP